MLYVCDVPFEQILYETIRVYKHFFLSVEIFDVYQTQLFLYIIRNELDSNVTVNTMKNNEQEKIIKMISDRVF